MSYVQVDNPSPVVIPAIAEKNFNKLWITKISIESPNPTAKAVAIIEGLPWDGGANILFSGPVVTRTIPDVFGLAASDTDAAAAVNAILTVVNKYAV
jgi:hypothetical protein